MRIIYKAYRYVFYRIYAWQLKKYSDTHPSEIAAMTGIFLVTSLNVISIPGLIEMFTSTRVLTITEITRLEMLPGVLLFLAIHYFILVFREKYKEIVKEFETETKEQRHKRGIYFWIYIIATPLLLFGPWFIMMARKG